MQYNLSEKNMHNYILFITLLKKYAPRLHILYASLHSIKFNFLLKITNNNTLEFSITNHMIIYKTFKSYMQYIIIQLYTYFKKCFLFLMRP